MVTLSSCSIWQIISFVLPLNEYGCVYAGITLGNIATLLCPKLSYEFRTKRSTTSSVCSLSCEKSERIYHALDKPKREKLKSVRTSENIAAAVESVREVSSTTIHHRSKQLNISEISLKRNLHEDTKSNWFRTWSQLTIQCVSASLNGSAIELQKMPILAKKKSYFYMKLILVLAGM